MKRTAEMREKKRENDSHSFLFDMKVSQYGKCQELLNAKSQKPSSAVMKLALMRTTTEMEDPEIPLLQRIRSLELPDSETAAQINVSQSSSNRQISTSTVQRRMHESGLHGWIAAKKPLLKDTNKKKILSWAKKHKQWTLDWWKSVLWSDEFKFEIFGSNRHVFVRRRVGERMIGACVVPTVNQIKVYLSRAPNTTGVDLTVKCTNGAKRCVCVCVCR